MEGSEPKPVAVQIDLLIITLSADAVPAPYEPSFVALTILARAPAKFRRGKPYPVRRLAEEINYSPSQTHMGLIELYRQGYVDAIPYGGNGRKSYKGNPAKLLNFPTDRKRRGAA